MILSHFSETICFVYVAYFETPAEADSPENYWAYHHSRLAGCSPEELKKIYSLSPLHVLAKNQIGPNDHVLDAGCGLGVLSLMNNQPSAKIVGIDSSPKVIEMARLYSPTTDYQVTSLNSLPFPDESFDLYIAVSSLELIPGGMEKALSEAFRVLKKGGRLFMGTVRLQPEFLFKTPKVMEMTMGRLVMEKYQPNQQINGERFYSYYYSGGELKKSVAKAGFQSVSLARSDLVGGLCYSRLLGPHVKQKVFDQIESHLKDSTFNQKMTTRLLFCEEGPFSSFLSLPRFLWSYWNVVKGTRPEE